MSFWSCLVLILILEVQGCNPDGGFQRIHSSLQGLPQTDFWLRPGKCSETRVAHQGTPFLWPTRMTPHDPPPWHKPAGMQSPIYCEADIDASSAASVRAQKAMGQDRLKVVGSPAAAGGEWGPEVITPWCSTWYPTIDVFHGFCHCHELPIDLFTFFFKLKS